MRKPLSLWGLWPSSTVAAKAKAKVRVRIMLFILLSHEYHRIHEKRACATDGARPAGSGAGRALGQRDLLKIKAHTRVPRTLVLRSPGLGPAPGTASAGPAQVLQSFNAKKKNHEKNI